MYLRVAVVVFKSTMSRMLSPTRRLSPRRGVEVGLFDVIIQEFGFIRACVREIKMIEFAITKSANSRLHHVAGAWTFLSSRGAIARRFLPHMQETSALSFTPGLFGRRNRLVFLGQIAKRFLKLAHSAQKPVVGEGIMVSKKFERAPRRGHGNGIAIATGCSSVRRRRSW
jgi:hypothetical protein